MGAESKDADEYGGKKGTTELAYLVAANKAIISVSP